MDRRQYPDVEIIDDDRLKAREVPSNRFAGLWWKFFLRGVLAAIVGIAALFWPTGSIALLLQLVGLLLVLDGAFTLFGFRRLGAAGGIGIGAILVGLILLIWPEGTARFGVFLIGAFALMAGVGSLLSWRQIPEWDRERKTARNAGIAALLLGLLLIFWPGSGLVALGWAIAFAGIAVSVTMFWLASRFKGAKERLKTKVINPR